MPIYEYRCDDCGKVFEEILSDTSIKSLPCPSCNSKKTEKLMSRIGAVGKGKSGSADFACGAGAPCPGAASCGAGGCCSGMN
jgi:putative FmdB family regulatory protein